MTAIGELRTGDARKPARRIARVREALRNSRLGGPASLRGELIGGTAGATASLALALSLGLLAFAPLGTEHARIGVFAGFALDFYGQIVAGLLGASAHPGSGPRASTSLVLGGLVAVLCADPALAPTALHGVERVVALAGLAVVLSGVLQIVAGALGAGQFTRYVPYPFIAGFMCGASALIIIAQFTPLTGIARAALLAAAPAAPFACCSPRRSSSASPRPPSSGPWRSS